MRWLRLLSVFISSRFRQPLDVNATSILSFHVWPTDIDVSIMNHAALMTVLETGRVDFMMRTGFFKLAKKNNWYFPLAAVSVQFTRPLKMLQKAILTTRVFHINNEWIYMEQKIVKDDKDIAYCIVRSTVRKGREKVTMEEILSNLKFSTVPSEASELIKAYEQESILLKQKLG